MACAAAAPPEAPTARLGAAAATAAPDAPPLAAPDAPSRRMRRTASAPALRAPCPGGHCTRCGAGKCGCLEVYVVSRAFSEFGGPLFRNMTPEMRHSMVDLGICHYMTVFRTPDGRYVQFDFGPHGGDVEKVNGPLGALLRRARRQVAEQHQHQQLQPMAWALAGGGGAGGGLGFGGSGYGGGGVHLSASAPSLEALAAAAAEAAGDDCNGCSTDKGFAGGGGFE
jgi:hypothetical protein